MKLFKIAILSIALISVGQLSAQTYTYKEVEAKASVSNAKITEGLDLTGDQQTLIFRQLITIEDSRMRMAGIAENEPRTKAAYASQYDSMVKQIQTVLSPEQFEQKKELIAELYAPVNK